MKEKCFFFSLWLLLLCYVYVVFVSQIRRCSENSIIFCFVHRLSSSFIACATLKIKTKENALSIKATIAFERRMRWKWTKHNVVLWRTTNDAQHEYRKFNSLFFFVVVGFDEYKIYTARHEHWAGYELMFLYVLATGTKTIDCFFAHVWMTSTVIFRYDGNRRYNIYANVLSHRRTQYIRRKWNHTEPQTHQAQGTRVAYGVLDSTILSSLAARTICISFSKLIYCGDSWRWFDNISSDGKTPIQFNGLIGWCVVYRN